MAQTFDLPEGLRFFSQNEWQTNKVQIGTIHSPLNGKKIGSISACSAEDLNTLATTAQEAFHKWSATPLKERSTVLFKVRELLLEEIDEISKVIEAESGKTRPEAKAGLLKGVEVLEFALSIQNLDQGGRMEVSRAVNCEYERMPLGVVGIISPFNFPAMVPMWMIPLALITGNSLVWKPSDKTPLTAYYLANIMKKAGLPPGVFNVANGGVETVNALIDHPLVKAIGFVGSSKVAEMVYHRGSKLNKRVLALGGAKNHIILLPDADLELSGVGIADSFTGCAGQRCMAASVLLAVGEVDHLIEKVLARAKATRPGMEMGAIITRESLSKLEKAIEKAISDGAKILLDGRNPQVASEYKEGNWIGPTILDNVKPGTEAACEELFGPILSIIRVKSIKEALEIQQSSPYGNACSVFTQNGALAQKVIKEAKAGMVGVNIGVPVPREPFSFGGIDQSRFGHGDITGMDGIEFWSQKKKITTKWASQSDRNWMS